MEKTILLKKRDNVKENRNVLNVVYILKKRVWTILAVMLGSGIVSLIISSYFSNPVYEATSQILVNQKKAEGASGLQADEIQTNVQLTNTYKVIIKSPMVLERVKNKMKKDTISIDDLNKKINVVSEAESQVISVTVKDKDIRRANDIVNHTVEVFKTEISTIMNVDNVTILSKADSINDNKPIQSRTVLNTIVAMIMGMFLSMSFFIIKEMLDHTVKNEFDVEEDLNVPMLGAISHLKKQGNKKGKDNC
ncbi:Wzz/FepE/Etk N-terminal domain-containing protein [Bacillus cereus group sp. BfR-BA-01349]|uniref:YveK family protein n=1 Tax=Bacillus cereus group sp. BfR-BA-01349 TaxID=2920312 RepID=UPI001F562F47